MDIFTSEEKVRWSDLDPNFHVRHSVYYDWGANCRVAFLYSLGLTTAVMQKTGIGPILFREECVFRKEIRMEDKITIGLKLSRAKKDYSRFTIVHEILKNSDTHSALLTVDIAWIDTKLRKLAVLPPEVRELFNNSPLTEDFQWLD
jgi:acyl-CoA thioester hydrolase